MNALENDGVLKRVLKINKFFECYKHFLNKVIYDVLCIKNKLHFDLRFEFISVTVFWIIKGIYLFAMHLRFGFMNYIFYLGIASAIIFLPFIGVILSKIVLSFMELLHQNKELVLTIQHILQFFS